MTDDTNNIIQAFQVIILARYLVGVPKHYSCEPTCTNMRHSPAPKGCVLTGKGKAKSRLATPQEHKEYCVDVCAAVRAKLTLPLKAGDHCSH